jgi:hypothetical protein
MIDNETIDRVCRGVGSVQEGELVRAEIERLRGLLRESEEKIADLERMLARWHTRFAPKVTADQPDAVQRDAARYRWLRHVDHAQLQVFGHYAGPALDEQIDKAMIADKPGAVNT